MPFDVLVARGAILDAVVSKLFQIQNSSLSTIVSFVGVIAI